MKRILALLLACLLLTGCGASTSNKEDTKEKELETIDVVLDWYPNGVHAFLYQAMDKGYFEDEGLKVNILFPANSTDPLTMPAAGKADIGFYYQEDVIIAKANENVPVKSLGAVVQEPLYVVCSLKDKGITKPEDLIGKTIGYNGTQFAELAVDQLLHAADASLEDVTMVDVGFDLMSSMTTGNVDATYGCFINHELPALEEEGFEMDMIQPTDYGSPNYYALMLVTGEKQLAERKDAYTRFLRACKKGFEDMKADPEGSLQLMLHNQDTENFPLNEAVERKSFEVLLPMMEKEGAPFLSQTVESWQENMDWLYENGMIKSTFDPNELIADLSVSES